MGSTSYITDRSGEITQHEEYIPFGESFVSEHRRNQYNSPFKFNGKEFDAETGLFYYGARYYNPRESVWLSVDPLAEAFPGRSPYEYTFSNPIKYIDPTGMAPEYEPTPKEAATMASHVYDGKIKLIGGWKVSDQKVSEDIIFKNDNNGLKSQLYERKINGKTEFTMVYAGTEDLKKDGLEDLLQAFGNSSQYSTAINNAELLKKDLGNSELTFVGHSLGGGLAQASALAIEGHAITFNPAWLSDSTIKTLNLSKSDKGITNYVIMGEALHNFQKMYGKLSGLKQMGTTKFLYSRTPLIPFFGSFMAHTIGEVLNKVKK